jgi:pimeloyl-ACP methyl ester carboxylesterase
LISPEIYKESAPKCPLDADFQHFARFFEYAIERGIDPMPRFYSRLPRFLTALLCAVAFLQPGYGAGSALKSTPVPSVAPPTFVFAFVGGFVHRDDSRHAEVRLIQRLREQYPKDVESVVFENHRYRDAYNMIRERLDADHDGNLSDDEKQNARILLFGHSWGASAAVSLARRLERDGIPVLLTAQVDSVAKRGQNDSVIPANVRQAVNFYQTRGLVHGRAKITAADPSRTKILGNFRLSYNQPLVGCRDYPWYDLLFTKPHTAIECDPNVWSQIESLVRNQLPDTGSQAASAPSSASAASPSARR